MSGIVEGPSGGDARTRELLAADARARHVAMTEFDRPVIIEAGAGTGKTATLVGRVVAWSVGRGWERADVPGQREEETAARVLDGLVAITFTEAAAAEMAERVAHALAALAAGRVPTGMGEVLRPGDAATGARAAALLTALDHLVVSTIHAFCRRILATYPLEAGLHPTFAVDADGSQLAAIAHEVVEGWLVDLFRRPAGGPAPEPEERAQHEAMLALAGEGLGPEAIAVALERLAGSAVPVEAVARDAFTDEAVAAVIVRVQGAVLELRELLDATVADAGRARNAQAIRAGLTLLHTEIGEIAPSRAALAVVQRGIEEALAPPLIGHLRKHWAHAQTSSAAEAEALGGRAFELRRKALAFLAARDHAARLRPELYDAARTLLTPMLRAVRERLRERGVITFDALLARARDLLVDRPDLRGRVRERIDQLLVDEFQDTDAVQCDLVRLLAVAPGPTRAPGLFVVGDPKQSIYGWRNADLAAYQGFVDDVVAAGGELGHLAANHRSVAPVLDEVERVVAQVMLAEPGLQPPFRPLVPAAVPKDEAWRPSGARAAVEHWVSWLPDPHEPGPLRRTLRSDEAAALEARALVADLRGLAGEAGFAWSQVGLLLRSTSDQDVYLEAMREARIPYVVERDKSYYRRREVIEAAALVRTVLDPTDHLALITFLRSAWVGVPDAAWIPLWAEGFPDRLTELHAADDAALAALDAVIERAAAAVPEDVPGLERVAGWDRALRGAVRDLAAAREAFACEPADRFVEILRTRFLPEAVEAARYLGGYRLANLERFFRKLAGALEAAGADPQALLRALRQSVGERRDAEEARPPEAAENAVRVMTIHKAKGLAFEHVYIAQAHKQSRPRPVSARISGDATEARRFRRDDRWTCQLFGLPAPDWGELVAWDDEVERAERVRLLYVALTRARTRVVVLGRWPDRGQGGAISHRDARSFMDLMQSRTPPGPPLIDAMRRIAEADGRLPWFLDAGEARWVFPALAPAAAKAEREAGRAEQPPVTLAEARLEERALATAREAAARRMARGMSGTASGRVTHDPGLEEAEGHRYREATSERAEAPPPWLLAVGTAVHLALEHLDLTVVPEDAVAAQRRALGAYLRPLVAEGERAAATRAAEGVLDRFAAGPLWPRLRELADAIVARELPLLAPPGPDGDVDAPVGFIAGAIDLLYRDPEDGALVIVDYKTDRVTGARLAARAASYRPQGEVYVRALAGAFPATPAPPRFELWFVWAGEAVTVDVNAPDGAALVR